MSREALDEIVDPLVVEDLLTSSLLLADGARVRAPHPLLAAAARRMSSARDKRAMHLDLAGSVGDETVRARHLALATGGWNAEIAGIVAKAAAGAFRRGASYDAVDLAQHALRLTPPAAAEFPERTLELAEFLVTVGEPGEPRTCSRHDLRNSRTAASGRGRTWCWPRPATLSAMSITWNARSPRARTSRG